MIKKYLVITIVSVFFVFPGHTAAAEKKHTVCHPGICQPRKSITKQYRPLITRTDGLITEKPVLRAKDFFLNESTSPLPNILVPAKREIDSVCHQNLQGRVLCHERVRYTGCPTDISMTVQTPNGPRVADCDLVCNPNIPDPGTGLCDCEPTNCVVQDV